MIRLDLPIIVEGKYDKITLENVVDALIITTDGFGIFKDKEKCQLIRMLAQKNGIIVMTDSDSAGNVIRSHIKGIVGDAKIINVYVPYLKGKEKRKTRSGKEGVLGVEGMCPEIIKEALLRSGISETEMKPLRAKITKLDLFEASLSGKTESSVKRKEFLNFLSFPQNLSANAMLDLLNNIMTRDEFYEVLGKWQKNNGKN